MGFGDSLKKWASSKATEMLTADSGKRDNAAASADAAEQQAKGDVGETLLRTAFPQVGEWADKQEADKVAKRAGRATRRSATRSPRSRWPPCSCRSPATRHGSVVGPAPPGVEGPRAGASRRRVPVARPLRRPALACRSSCSPRTPRVPTLGGLLADALGLPDPRLHRRRHLRPHRDRSGARGRGRGAGVPRLGDGLRELRRLVVLLLRRRWPVDGHGHRGRQDSWRVTIAMTGARRRRSSRQRRSRV